MPGSRQVPRDLRPVIFVRSRGRIFPDHSTDARPDLRRGLELGSARVAASAATQRLKYLRLVRRLIPAASAARHRPACFTNPADEKGSTGGTRPCSIIGVHPGLLGDRQLVASNATNFCREDPR